MNVVGYNTKSFELVTYIIESVGLLGNDGGNFIITKLIRILGQAAVKPSVEMGKIDFLRLIQLFLPGRTNEKIVIDFSASMLFFRL